MVVVNLVKEVDLSCLDICFVVEKKSLFLIVTEIFFLLHLVTVPIIIMTMD